MYDTTSMWIPKKKKEFIYKMKIESQMQQINLWLPGCVGGGGINWEVGTDVCTVLCIKQISNEHLS